MKKQTPMDILTSLNCKGKFNVNKKKAIEAIEIALKNANRIEIAALAMQGILANEELRCKLLMDSKASNNKTTPEKHLIKTAYEYADELLKQGEDG